MLPPEELAYRRQEVPWPSAYNGNGPVEPSSPRFSFAGPRCALYRHYDADEFLLYVGITERVAVRGKAHAKTADWVQFAERVEARWYPSRADAEKAEESAIKVEKPLFNVKHNNTPEARERLRAYLAEKGRLDLLPPAAPRR